MNSKNFLGKSFTVVKDFSLDEQLHLYEMTKKLKEAIKDGNKTIIDAFKINNKDFGIYTVFLEDSTRTKSSFKNAADLLNVKFSDFDSSRSSFNKNESYADGFNMLTGYDNKIFVVRSKEEGLCAWLEKNGKSYAERNDITAPAFINAGDGKHEHPTQELLDEFTFLEDSNWKRDHIHIALIGDLLHGRTAHSKAEGLNAFKNIQVDLIAPPPLAMPKKYIEDMQKNGYEIRIFGSMEEYTSQKKLAPKRYFTRPQLERMGEDILKQQDALRDTITLHPEYLKKIDSNNFKFYHPLPQHKEQPTIPVSLMETPYNGIEKQSANGRYIRAVLLSAIAGNTLINGTFRGQSHSPINYSNDFYEEIVIKSEGPKKISEGVNPIKNGINIDHICKGQSEEEIREYLSKIVSTLKLYGKGGIWVSQSRKDKGVYKGMLFRPNGDLSEEELRKLACIVPGCTVNYIINSKVARKLRLHMPSRIEGLEETHCKNKDCISHPSHTEYVPSSFIKTGKDSCICGYCDTPHNFKEIWA